MTVLQGALESGAPAPGGGGEQIRTWPQAVIATPRPVPDMVTSIRVFVEGGR